MPSPGQTFYGSLSAWMSGGGSAGASLSTVGMSAGTGARPKVTVSYAEAYTQQVISSTIGQPISISRGSRLVKGQLLWSSSIKQQTKTTTTTFPDPGHSWWNTDTGQSQGTVPDPISNIETTRLYVDCAIGFGQVLNPEVNARILELRAGNVRLYSSGAGGTASLKSMGFRLYSGTETQLPDKLLEKYLGVGNVPAYRGEMYVVFEQLDLLAFGGAFPDLYALISDGAPSDEFPFNELVPAGGEGFRGNGAMFDPETRAAYWLSGSGEHLYQINTVSKSIVGSIPLETAIGGFQSNVALAEWVGLFFGTDGSPLNVVPIYAVSLDTGRVLHTFGFTAPSSTANTNSRFATSQFMVAQIVNVGAGQPPITFLVCSGIFNNLGLLSWKAQGVDAGFKYQGHANGTPDMYTGCRGPVLEKNSFVYLAGGSKVWQVTLNVALLNRQSDVGDIPFPLKADGSYDATAWIDTAYGSIIAVHYFERDDSIIVFCTGTGSDPDKVFCFDRLTKGLVWQTEVTHAGSNISTTRWLSNIEFGYISWTAVGEIYSINCRTGEFSGSEGSLGVVGVNNDSDYFFDFDSGAFFAYGSDHSLGYINGSSTLGQRIALSDVLAELSAFVDLTEDEYSIDPRITDEVDGFILQGALNVDYLQLVRTIGQAFSFTVTEAGNGVRMVKQMVVDGAEDVTASLTEADLATQRDTDFPRNSGDPFADASVVSTRTPDYNIVDYIDIEYTDSLYDYTPNSAMRARAKLPSEVRRKGKDLNINIIPIIMKTGEASTLAANLLYQNLSKRLSHSFRLKAKHSRLEPGDVLDLPAADHTIRCKLEQMTYHHDFSISVVAADYLNSDDSMLNDGQTPIVPPTPAVEDNRSQFIPIDMPALFSDDYIAGNRVSIYFALGGLGQAGWRGASVLRSPDGGLYERIGQTSVESYWGRVTTPLNDPGGSVFGADETSVMTFKLFAGDPEFLETVDSASWYAGGFLAIVGLPGKWELISIREFDYDASTKLFTVRGILRGLRDTYMNAGQRRAGEYIIFPQMGEGLGRIVEAPELLDEIVYYKGVGRDINSFKARAYRTLLHGEAERPMSVVGVHIVEEMDTDLVFTWHPQDPANIGLSDGIDYDHQTFPDNYRVDILDGPGGAVMRTVNVTDARTWTYSAANQATDGLTAGAVNRLWFLITHISAVYGDGRTFERSRYVE